VRIGLPLQYAGDVRAAADQVRDLEKAGLDVVWVAEAYGLDGVSCSATSPRRPRPSGSARRS
jgi:alkanesulfonate monooxygenase SsuD/methylene tetrahydromethanopterin reductase-like flavin-dependent oxidoreductase (luciferase family)